MFLREWVKPGLMETREESMAVTLEAPFIETSMPYVDPKFGTTIIYEFERNSTTHHFDPRPMRVFDARAEAPDLTIQRNGFTLVKHRTAMKNFRDPDEVKRIYYPEIERLVRDMTGAEKVLVFGDTVRSDDPAKPPSDHEPAPNAHIDFNEKTVRRLAAGMLGADAAKYDGKRVALINLWRGIETVERAPLAVCDASTVKERDLVLGLIGTRPDDKDFPYLEGFNLAYSPAHRWYYYPRMTPDELLVFKLCDSDRSQAQLTGHTAIADPSSAPNARPRQSFEIRTISFFAD
jgi:hypothetical protein